MPELGLNIGDLLGPLLLIQLVGFLLGVIVQLPFGLDTLHLVLQSQIIYLDRLILLFLLV